MTISPLRALVVAAAAGAFAVPATAAITFAQFNEQNTMARTLEYKQQADLSYTVLTGPVAVDLTAFALHAPETVGATFQLDASTFDTPTKMPNLPIVGQNSFNGTLSLVDGGVNYLTLNFTDAVFMAVLGQTNGSFSSLGPVTFSSDYFDLSQVSGITFSLGFTGFDKPFALGQDFKSNVTGTFDATLVPEPASWMMMIAGFGLVGVGIRHRRNRVSVHAS
ncbi:MAG: PEPxxWA-CTERM sorting domain-containing protein [Sphingomonadaceae bacterium]